MSPKKKDYIFWQNITSNLGASFCEVFDCREERCFENPILSIHPLFEWQGAVVINNGWIKFKPEGTFRSSLRASLYHETWHFSRLSWTELTHLFSHLFSWSHQQLKSLSAWSFFSSGSSILLAKLWFSFASVGLLFPAVTCFPYIDLSTF